jgi:hypothetical protein
MRAKDQGPQTRLTDSGCIGERCVRGVMVLAARFSRDLDQFPLPTQITPRLKVQRYFVLRFSEKLILVLILVEIIL